MENRAGKEIIGFSATQGVDRVEVEKIQLPLGETIAYVRRYDSKGSIADEECFNLNNIDTLGYYQACRTRMLKDLIRNG